MPRGRKALGFRPSKLQLSRREIMFNKWAEGAAYFYLRQQTNKPGFTGTFSVLPGRSDQSSVFCGNGSCVLWLLSTAASRWYPLNLPGVCSVADRMGTFDRFVLFSAVFSQCLYVMLSEQ